MNRIRRARLNGSWWRFEWVRPRRDEDAKTFFDERRIMVGPDIDGRRRMAALVDEVLHTHLPRNVNNNAVDRMSNDVARILHRDGYRRLRDEA